MIPRNPSASRVFRCLLVCALGTILLWVVPVRASSGTISFHATVSGKTHESGSFTHDTSSHGDPRNPFLDFTGCAVVKQGSKSVSGRYIFEVQTVMIQLAGLKPTGPGVNLTVDHFRPNASTGSYSGLDVSGTFAVNGHSYGDMVGLAHGTVKIRNGGKSGTWIDPTAQRNYPARPAHPVPGYSFKTSWKCSTVLHQNAQ